MIGLLILLYLIVSTIVGILMIVLVVKAERKDSGYVTLGDFLLALLMCLCPVLNLVVVYTYLDHMKVFQKQLFAVKKVDKAS